MRIGTDGVRFPKYDNEVDGDVFNNFAIGIHSHILRFLRFVLILLKKKKKVYIQ